MAMAKEEEAWHGCYKAVVAAPIRRVWEITSDFVGIEKWAPSVVSASRLVQGHRNEAGCLRSCNGVEGGFLGSERLLSLDAEGYRYSYQVEESRTKGLPGYVSTFQLAPDPSDAQRSTLVEWSYCVAPIPSSSALDFQAFIFGYYALCLSDLANFLSSS